MKKKKNYSLANRVLKYEDSSNVVLTPKETAIIKIVAKGIDRLDLYEKQMWEDFETCLMRIAPQIASAEFIYHHGNETYILLKDYSTWVQEQYMQGNIQKIVSSVVSKMTMFYYTKSGRFVEFSARCFSIPRAEVLNYFVWKQKEAIKNCINHYASLYYSEQELAGQKIDDRIDLLFKKNVEWYSFPDHVQRGFAIVRDALELPLDMPTEQSTFYSTEEATTIVRKKWMLDEQIPLFHEEPIYITDIL